jgi:hypothetical protein
MKYNTITKRAVEKVPAGIYEGIDYHGEPPVDVAARAGWVDLTPEIQAQLDAQATLDAEKAAAEYRAANLQLWIYHNAFFLLIQNYFGDMTKRGTKELLAKAFTLADTDLKAAMQAFGVMVALDKELVRTGGDLWWDTAEWHNDPDAIAGAQEYLS